MLLALVGLVGGVSLSPASAASASSEVPLTPADFQMVPADMQPQGFDIAPVSPISVGSDPNSAVNGLTPVPSMTSASSNVFKVHGADHLLQVFSQPVNYQDASGAWVPIQRQLVSDGSGGFTNKAGPFKLEFPGTWSASTPVTFGQGAYALNATVSGMGSATVSPNGQTGVTYSSVLSGVDVSFVSTNEGYRDVITLRDASAPSTVAYALTVSGGLSLAAQPDGSIGILDKKGNPVGSIPAPTASDAATNPATGDPDQGQVSYQLTSTGNSAYRLAVVVDPAWLAQATYPVVIDPSISPAASQDTYVDDGFPNTSYGGSTTLHVKAVSGSNAQHAYALFPIASYYKSGRVIVAATAEMYATSVADTTAPVNLKQVTGGWGENMTWNTQPNVDGTIQDTAKGSANHWFQWNVPSLYQTMFNSQVNNGVFFGTASQSSNNEFQFASSETTIKDVNGNFVQPQLVLQYDDPPDAPTLATAPTDGGQITYASPTLGIQGNATDPNSGDTLYVKYQVSTSLNDFSNPVWDSGWLENGDSGTVPAGVLLDGQTYYWRAQVWDGWQHPDNSDIVTNSAKHSFTVVLPHYGDDSRWPMWKDQLGNGITLQVNEATGNLFLDDPLQSIKTPAGSLDLGLTYNSQDTEGAPAGLGPGWSLAAGPGTDPSTLPSGMSSVDWPNTLIIHMRDGSRLPFAKAWTGNTLHTWIATGANAGNITENTNGTTATYTYEPTSGGRYEFDANGHLIDASPETTDDGQPGFNYTFSGTTPRLSTVTEPDAVTISFAYDTNSNLKTITQAGLGETHVWNIVADSAGRIKSINDPEQRTVTFNYGVPPGGDGKTYLTSVVDGGTNTWTVGYTNPNLPPPVAAPQLQVASVQDPGTYDTNQTGGTAAIPPTQFDYFGDAGGNYTGHVDNHTTITDPNGNTTTVDMDVEGFPIEIDQPAETISGQQTVPTTTMVWDTNGNLLCKREPAANLKAPGCTAADHTDALQTDYSYQTIAPFKLVKKQAPTPDLAGIQPRPIWTYNYDENLTGLEQENYNSTSFTGMPLNREMATSTPATYNWGNADPTNITTNSWAVRITGKIHATQSTNATYHFHVYALGGARLVIGHKVMDDCWNNDYAFNSYNCNGNGTAGIMLGHGSTARFTLEYHHFATDTNANVDVEWDNGNGSNFTSISGGTFDPGLDLLTSETNPAGLTTTYTYAANHPVRGQATTIAQSDGNGTSTRTETLTYDSYGRVLVDTHAVGTSAATSVTNTYNTTKPCVSNTTDGAQESVDYTCDAEGDLLTETRNVPTVSSTKQTEANQVTTTQYNQLGQVTSVQQGSQPATLTTYYPTGLVHTVTDPLLHQTTYTYTAAGKVHTETLDSQSSSNKETITYGYDANGNGTFTKKQFGSSTYIWTAPMTHKAAYRPKPAQE